MIIQIKNSIEINRPVKNVFECITTPETWPEWHPRVISVKGATDHSLMVGEHVIEEFIDVESQRYVIWTVIECEVTRRWIVDGVDLVGNDAGRVAFIFKESRNGTIFERENTYIIPNFFLAIYNLLVIRHRKESETAQALQELKKYLERKQPVGNMDNNNFAQLRRSERQQEP